MEINANRSMMRCDVWRVWMNDYEKLGQSKKMNPDEYGGNNQLLIYNAKMDR